MVRCSVLLAPNRAGSPENVFLCNGKGRGVKRGNASSFPALEPQDLRNSIPIFKSLSGSMRSMRPIYDHGPFSNCGKQSCSRAGRFSLFQNSGMNDPLKWESGCCLPVEVDWSRLTYSPPPFSAAPPHVHPAPTVSSIEFRYAGKTSDKYSPAWDLDGQKENHCSPYTFLKETVETTSVRYVAEEEEGGGEEEKEEVWASAQGSDIIIQEWNL